MRSSHPASRGSQHGDLVPTNASHAIPVGVVGCGAVAARLHLPLLAERDDVELRALVDLDRSRAVKLGRRYGAPHALTHHRELNSVGVRAAVVTVPNHLHASVSADLLDDDIHVLVEKPMARTSEECSTMLAAGERTGAVLAPALPLRFSHTASVAKSVLMADLLGPIAGVQVEYGAGAGWPAVTDHLLRREIAGGGSLLDLGSHVIDLLLWWFGDAEVVAYRDDSHGGVEADCEVNLALPSGVVASIELSRTRDLHQSAALIGEHATLKVGLGHNQLELSVRRGALAGKAKPSALPAAREQGTADLVDAIHDDFFGAVSTGVELTVPAVEAARSISLIEDCYASRRPLRLPWLPLVKEPAPRDATLQEESNRRAATGRPPATLGSPSLSGRRVLVTGASGFIGGRVAEKLVLEHGAEVRALIRRPASAIRLARLPIEFAHGSISDLAAVRNAAQDCDVIINCAHDYQSASRNRQTGVVGVRVVAQAALEAEADRMVHLSSYVVYGMGHVGDLDETSPWEPTTNSYIKSKQDGEELLVGFHHEHGLPVAILQPTIVYGPWGKVWTAQCVEQLTTGLLALVEGGQGLCNAVYIDDVAAAVLRAATAPGAVGERFLISASQPISWRQFYAGFEEAIGRRATLDVSAEMLPRLARYERRRARRRLLRLIMHNLRRTAADPATIELLRRLPVAQRAAGLLADVLPDEHWENLKSALTAGQRSKTAGGRSRPKIHVPTGSDVSLYLSRARVRIDKASEKLGYEPRFDFDEGMEQTTEFIRWARLARR